jgi:hypothetical protein
MSNAIADPPHDNNVGLDDEDLAELSRLARLDDIKDAMIFIEALRSATLDNGLISFDPDALERLRNPPREVLSIDDPDVLLSLKLFLADTTEAAYNSIRNAIMERFPDSEVLSYYQVRRRVALLSGIQPIVHDMCIDLCVAFCGPWRHHDKCPKCGQDRYDQNILRKSHGRKKVPVRVFETIPVADQIQALWRDPSSAQKMRYRDDATNVLLEKLRTNGGIIDAYEDFFDGTDYLDAVRLGKIKEGDPILMLSIDGAQLYESKQSDCWIYIWVVFDHHPQDRYKKKYVLPGGFIPGPNKPKNVDSFLFPGLYHLAAVQREGLTVWDASQNRVFKSTPFLALATADGPGMVYLNGLVGSHGGNGCRLYCGTRGRHKPGAGGHYYPALLKPVNYNHAGSNHPDIDINNLPPASSGNYRENLKYLMESRTQTQYEQRRLETGISKPTIFLGIQPNNILGIPGCFGSDIMHLAAINIADELIPIWRGSFRCEPTDDKETWDWAVLKGRVWQDHGKAVADATPYLPGSFDRPPRNPAQKINSGYKAWEFLLYLFGLGPAILYGVLPDVYWKNFCKLVRGIRIMQQHKILASDLCEAHEMLAQFEKEFKLLYYQRRVDCLHFMRPWAHSLGHLAPETITKGPPICSSQWTMERTIGNLGREIRSHSQPYANLSERGVRRCQVNALKVMIPTLDPPTDTLPRCSVDLGHGYVLLTKRERTPHHLLACEAMALISYLAAHGNNVTIDQCPRIIRWARLQIPNGQVARSSWKENAMTRMPRMARNIKVSNIVFTSQNSS